MAMARELERTPSMTRILWLVLGLTLTGCTEHGSGGGALTDGGGGSGRACGGFAGTNCPPGEFCDFGRNSCGRSDEGGTCRARPGGCPDLFSPVCGCDGNVHSNECDAQAIGVDVDASGACPLMVGQFTCGFRACSVMTEYCQRGVSDVGNEPDSFTCMDRPNGCNAAGSCACLSGEPCGSLCEGSAAEGMTLTCPGG